MIVLGIDPGQVSAWVQYDTGLRRAIACAEFSEFDITGEPVTGYGDFVRPQEVVIERPKGYGPTRPQLVDCGYVCGRIIGAIYHTSGHTVEEMTRHEVCKILTDATHGEVRVRNDATAWAALVLLHGDGSDKKPRRKAGKIIDPGGAIGSVTGHARAALAVAVAWSIRQQQQQEKTA